FSTPTAIIARRSTRLALVASAAPRGPAAWALVGNVILSETPGAFVLENAEAGGANYEKWRQTPNLPQGYPPRPSRTPPGGAARRRQSASLPRFDDPFVEHGRMGGQTRHQNAVRGGALRSSRHADDLCAGRRFGGDRGGLPGDADVIRPCRDYCTPAGLPQMRRPHADGCFCVG